MMRSKYHAHDVVKSVKSTVIIVIDSDVDRAHFTDQFAEAIARISHPALRKAEVVDDPRSGNLELHLNLRVEKFADASDVTSEIVRAAISAIPEFRRDYVSTGTNLLAPA